MRARTMFPPFVCAAAMTVFSGAATSAVVQLPASGAEMIETLDGRLANSGDAVRTYLVSPGWMEAANFSVRAGRDFTPADDAAAVPVAIVNETLATRLSKSGTVLGLRVNRLENINPLEVGRRQVMIVGVVAAQDRGSNAHHEAALFVPLAQARRPR